MKIGLWIILIVAFAMALILSATGILPDFIFGTDYAILIWIALFVLLAFGFIKIIFR